MNDDPRLDLFLRNAGADLEKAFREAGSALPEGMTGEQLVRALMDDAVQRASSEEGKERGRRVVALARQLEAEFPRGVDDPEFVARLGAGIKEIYHETGSGPAASA